MKNIILPQYLHPPVPTRLFAHRLKRPGGIGVKASGMLIITGYDYFLHKGDFKQLFQRYSDIILVPRSVDDVYLLNYTIRPLLSKHSDLHLVTNPAYDSQHRIVYEFIVRQSKSIRVSTVNDFCEHYLSKLYIPETESERPLSKPIAPFPRRVKWAKKSVDVLASAGILAVSWPLWLMSAFQIRYQSPGPVFYRQPRVGKQETEFDCIKFRSMRLDAEASGAAFSSPHDKRVFAYGALMRSLRIDELPQLVNVIKGEMSLIGPRPERKVFTDSFEEIIPHYAQRHVVKPGITGYAQISYPYGVGARDARHKLMYDLYYIKNWSLGLEIKIIARTVLTMLTKKGW